MNTRDQDVTQDFTPTVATLKALIQKYDELMKYRHRVLSMRVEGGKISRTEYNQDAGVYTDLMNGCMVFVANYGVDIIKHADLMNYLYRVAYRNYNEMTGRKDHSLREIIFTEEVVNERFKDVRIVFVPANVNDTLISYKTSVPHTEGTGEHLLPMMIDKLMYCQSN